MVTSIFLHPNRELQNDQRSFIGGRPRLPATIEVPRCKLCGADQTFFFQIEFFVSGNTVSQTLAVFACTSCADEKHLIPELAAKKASLKEAEITEEFLRNYQANFSLIIFATEDAVLRSDYDVRILFKALKGLPNSIGREFAKLGGAPDWVLDDEAPKESEFEFLLQVHEGYEFETVDGTSHQIVIDLWQKPTERKEPYYDLFLQNELYFFVSRVDLSLVYLLTQID